MSDVLLSIPAARPARTGQGKPFKLASDYQPAGEPYPEARKPAYKPTVDFGPGIGLKRSSAQIAKHYRLEELPGRQVAAVVNFQPKQIGKFMSEVLVLGFPDAGGEVVMVGVDHPVPNGGKLF